MTSLKPLSFALIAFTILITGCTIPQYSFTGADVPVNVKTISIETFPSYASLAPPALSQQFTEALKDIFIRQTDLTLVKNNGDLQIDGQITDYRFQEAAVGGNDQASLSKLTISVKVIYTDTKNEENSYEKTFSNFEQFDSNQNPADVQDQLIEEINVKLVQDIFNQSLGNW